MIIKVIWGSLSNAKMKTSTHVLLGEGSGKNLDGDVRLLRKNFIMVNELKYNQSLKI